MLNYDFHSLLEPLEFQNLVCEIIQIRDKINLEMFKEGRDSGIDGLYSDHSRKIIVQAKRYEQNFNRLYHDIKNIELPKVKRLKPQRYILATSIDLAYSQKGKLLELCEGYIIESSDILGKKDINNLLGKTAYKEIELSYTKLWMPSIPVFRRVLDASIHGAIYKESELKLKETIKNAATFVPTRIYRKALYHWSKNNVLVLSGEPGVGKTTMACILALSYLQPNNLDGFIWANSIDDVYKVLNDEQKQVIILDDFWGSVFFNHVTHRNDENRLEKLIRDIMSFKGEKRLLLTTREYVLQQGLQKHPALNETLSKYAFMCTIEEYGQDEKAKILFSHLYSSNIAYEYVAFLYNKCDWIIFNRNYSPRTLAVFLEREPEKNIPPNEYYEELLDYFDHPGNLWKSVFWDLSREAQFVAMLLLISSTPMRLDDMELCYQKYIQNCSDKMTVKNLGDCIDELEKTMIKSFYSEDEDIILIRFSMPSIQDFLFEYMKENSEQCIPSVLQCCNFYNQLQFILEYISASCSKKVNELITQQCILHYEDYGYCYMDYDGSWEFNMDILAGYSHERLHRFFDLIRCCEPKRHPELFQFLEKQIKNYSLTMGNDDMEAQYTDLHNLPDIIVRCVHKGMIFDGAALIAHYFKNAFSIYHYKAMDNFEKVFPEEYEAFHRDHFEKIKKSVRSIILNEIDFLQDMYMDADLDVLIDSIPDLLSNFGLRYTKSFGQQILNLCGREPMLSNQMDVEQPEHVNDYKTTEEQLLEDIKEETQNWLLGIEETFLEDHQIAKMINESGNTLKIKSELTKALDTGYPSYIFELLQTRESLSLLRICIERL